ncbi:hypothetical protein [Streptomyces sp. NPDC001770]
MIAVIAVIAVVTVIAVIAVIARNAAARFAIDPSRHALHAL